MSTTKKELKNVYAKIAAARQECRRAKIELDGQDSFNSVFQAISSIAIKHELLCAFSFFENNAVLTITDIVTPFNKLTFETSVMWPFIKERNYIKNLGITQMYLKSYLYQQAFEIIDKDIFGAAENPNKDNTDKNKYFIKVIYEASAILSQFKGDTNRFVFWQENCRQARESGNVSRLNNCILKMKEELSKTPKENNE